MANFTVTGDWSSKTPNATLNADVRIKQLGATAEVPDDVAASVVAGVLKRASGSNDVPLPAPNGGVVVTGTGPFSVTFANALGKANQPQMTATASLTGGSTPGVTIATATGGDGSTDEIQTVTITGGPTGGSFTLTFSGQTTAAIPYNATALQIQAALQALSNVGRGAQVFYQALFRNITLDGFSVDPQRVLFQAAAAGGTVDLDALFPNLAVVA